MKRALRRVPLNVLISIFATYSVATAQVAKEGTYDLTACWSGVSNTIAFSPTHSAFSYEMMGTGRSTPPGGMFDQTSFRCVGVNHSFDGKVGGTAVCEVMDKDGHKYLSYFSLQDGKSVRQQVTGTGKYEGMVVATTVAPLGPFPTIKPGTFQNCNRQSGTYKLK